MSCVDVPIIQNNCNFILFVFTFYAVEEVEASS